MVVMVVQLFYALYSIYLNFNMNGMSQNKARIFRTSEKKFLVQSIVFVTFFKHFSAHTYKSHFLFLWLHMSIVNGVFESVVINCTFFFFYTDINLIY